MKKLRIVTVLLLILSAFVLVGCEDSIELAEDEVKVRESATSLAGKNYEDVVEQLEVWGFTNIKTEAVYDIFWGITKEGTTKSVKIGGSETFKSGDIYKKDVSIVVTYSMKASDDPTKQKYKITWQYDDGTIIKIEDVLWGVTPNYTGTIPSKKSTNELRYEFNGWSPVMTVVNGEQTYTAIFSEVANTFTISWKNDNGSILETDNDVMNGATPEYNGITPVKNETSQYSFEFIGWSPNVVPANDNTEYIAVFKETLKTYTITWVDSDDNVLQIDENVEYGIIPSFDGVVPVNEPTVAITYVFGGWSPGVQAVSGNQTYKTIIHEEKTKYTIAIDTKGGVLENTEIIFDYADTVYNLEEPRKNGFIFTGWSLENEPLIFPYTLLKNIQIVANYKELKPYELIWDFYTNISNSNSFIVNDSEGYIQFLSNDSNSQAIYNKEGAYGFYYNLNGYEFMIVMDLVNSQFSYVDKYNY
ncbi:InlB B-repeat-containing protein, partial [Acholeplasma laidlawii]